MLSIVISVLFAATVLSNVGNASHNESKDLSEKRRLVAGFAGFYGRSSYTAHPATARPTARPTAKPTTQSQWWIQELSKPIDQRWKEGCKRVVRDADSDEWTFDKRCQRCDNIYQTYHTAKAKCLELKNLHLFAVDENFDLLFMDWMRRKPEWKADPYILCHGHENIMVHFKGHLLNYPQGIIKLDDDCSPQSACADYLRARVRRTTEYQALGDNVQEFYNECERTKGHMDDWDEAKAKHLSEVLLGSMESANIISFDPMGMILNFWQYGNPKSGRQNPTDKCKSNVDKAISDAKQTMENEPVGRMIRERDFYLSQCNMEVRCDAHSISILYDYYGYCSKQIVIEEYVIPQITTQIVIPNFSWYI